ncbi:MAG: ADOP family duplicated permease [Phycisphaerales bacterium]
MTTFWQDLRYGLRMLRKSPGFTAIALITLAIGIGANTMMSSIADWLLFLQPRHVKNYEQLACCDVRAVSEYTTYLTLRDSVPAFSEVMAQSRDGMVGDVAVIRGDTAWHGKATYVSSNYFSFLGVAPVLGRGFLPGEDQQGSAAVVVLSHPLWQRLGGDPKLVGESVNVNGAVCQVVGVAPKGFTGTSLLGPGLWVPLGNWVSMGSIGAIQMREQTRPANAGAGWGYPWALHAVGRLKPGVSMSVAQTQLQALIPRFRAEDPKEWPAAASFSLRSPDRLYLDSINRPYLTKYSLILMAGSVVTLLIVCLNLASMLIVQGASRHREIAIRLAVGGGRLRIVRQLLVESALLALLGGVLGVLLAVCGMRILNVWFAGANWEVMRAMRVGLGIRILMGTLGFCLIATLLFGLRPALRLSRRDLAGEMKGSAGRVLGSVHRRRGGLSVAGQITLAVALVLVAALLLRTALETARPDPRFHLENTLVVRIDPESAGYDRTRSIQACEALADHLVSLPGVEALGSAPSLFYGGGGEQTIREYRPGAEEGESRGPRARYTHMLAIGRDYLPALEVPLLQGRLFDRQDSVPDAEKVAIINETLAHRLRPDGSALGCLVQYGVVEFDDWCPDVYRVVGVVTDLPDVQEREPRPQMYVPAGPDDLSLYFYLHVRDRKAVETLRSQMVQEIRRVDPYVPVLSVTTLAQIHDDDFRIWYARFHARLALAAGAVALFLAALGIYAIKGYMVTSRTSEIGIRMAMGATRGSIMAMILREGLVVTAVSLLVGLLLGLAVARIGASRLYGVGPADPASILVTVVLLGATSVLAGYLPARRAAKVDPMVALRCE